MLTHHIIIMIGKLAETGRTQVRMTVSRVKFRRVPGGTPKCPFVNSWKESLPSPFLVLSRTEKEWTMPAREWGMAKAQFAILFGDRYTKAMV